MFNRSVFLCGLILILLILICYLLTSVDLGQFQKNLQQWTKNKISLIHTDKPAGSNNGINKDVHLAGSGEKTIKVGSNVLKTKGNIHNSSVFFNLTKPINFPEKPVKIKQMFYNVTSERLNGIRVYDWSIPVNNDSRCVPLKNLPSTTIICLFDPLIDATFSKSILKTGLWDAHLVKQFRLLLGRRRDLNVLDIGSSLGLYSLIAASLGHYVMSVEPFPLVFPYFHRSVVLNKFEKRITLLANAISNKNEFVKMSVKAGDMTSAIARPAEEAEVTINNIASQKVVTAITWKDLAYFVPFTKIILKYDISQADHNNMLITEAEDLFSTLDVQYIFMHWSYHDILDVGDILAFLTNQSFVPKKHVFGKRVKWQRFHKFKGGIIWEKVKH